MPKELSSGRQQHEELIAADEDLLDKSDALPPEDKTQANNNGGFLSSVLDMAGGLMSMIVTRNGSAASLDCPPNCPPKFGPPPLTQARHCKPGECEKPCPPPAPAQQKPCPPPPCPKPCPPPPCPKPCPPPPCPEPPPPETCPPPPRPKPCPPPPCPTTPPCPKPCPPPPCPEPCPPPPRPEPCPPPPVCCPPPCPEPCPPCPPLPLPECNKCPPPDPPCPPKEVVPCTPLCPEPPPPPKPCPPPCCPFPEKVKIPCVVESAGTCAADIDGRTYMCVRIDDPPEPCMPDPSKSDEIILNCTINGCVAECTQYVCKKKEPKEEVCDSEEEEPPRPEEKKPCPLPTWPLPCIPSKVEDYCDSPLADFDEKVLLPEFYTPEESEEDESSDCGDVCCWDTMLRAKIAEPICINPMELWDEKPRPCVYCPPTNKICMEQYGCVPVQCGVVCTDEGEQKEECVREEDPCPDEDLLCQEDPCKPCCCAKQETEIVVVAVEEVDCPTPDPCPVCPPPDIEMDPPCGPSERNSCWDMMLKKKLDEDVGINPEDLLKQRHAEVIPMCKDRCNVCCKIVYDDEKRPEDPQ